MTYSLAVLHDRPVRLSIEGQLDVQTVNCLRLMLDRVVERNPLRVEIDLSRLRLVDSAGLGVLIHFCKRLRLSGCSPVVMGLRGQPLAVLRLLRLDRLPFAARGGADWN